MQEPRYNRTPECVRFSNTQGHVGPTLQGGLALMYDRVEGMVLRHGDAPAVDAYYVKYVAVLAGTDLREDIVMLVLDLDMLTPALLNEVNRAIQISGYLAENAHLLGAPL
jgi:hypothetical protein